MSFYDMERSTVAPDVPPDTPEGTDLHSEAMHSHSASDGIHDHFIPSSEDIPVYGSDSAEEEEAMSSASEDGRLSGDDSEFDISREPTPRPADTRAFLDDF